MLESGLSKEGGCRRGGKTNERPFVVGSVDSLFSRCVRAPSVFVLRRARGIACAASFVLAQHATNPQQVELSALYPSVSLST